MTLYSRSHRDSKRRRDEMRRVFVRDGWVVKLIDLIGFSACIRLKSSLCNFAALIYTKDRRRKYISIRFSSFNVIFKLSFKRNSKAESFQCRSMMATEQKHTSNQTYSLGQYYFLIQTIITYEAKIQYEQHIYATSNTHQMQT